MIFLDYDAEINIDEKITDSANKYYKLSKKMIKKTEGVKKAINITLEKIKKADSQKIEKLEVKTIREKEWFEKYRFSFTRNGLLILAGMDSTTNEIIVKKYMDKNDLHFHTNIVGSAHVLLKNGQSGSKEDFEDAALIAAIYSKAWKSEFGSVDVFFVKPEQVSKTPETGEFLNKGAFVIRGERNWFKKVSLNFCIGTYKKDRKLYLIPALKEVFEKNKSDFYTCLIPGRKTKTEIIKQIIPKLFSKNIKQFNADDFLHTLPAGKFDFDKKK